MAKNNNLTDFLTGVADAIRAKKGTFSTINPQDFESEIETIQTGVDTADATATAADIRVGKTAYVNEEKVEGSIQDYNGESEPASGKSLFAQLVDRSITEVTAEDLAGITEIGKYAFVICEKLISVTIPDGVKYIGAYAFEGCGKLSDITIPESVTIIYRLAFSSCKALTSITIPDSVTGIGDTAFGYCSSLMDVKLSNHLTRLDSDIFSYCRALTNIVIPNSVTSINNSAFSYCEALPSIAIPDSVTSIGFHVFDNCKSLTSITIGNGVTSIGINAFNYCSTNTEFGGTYTILATTPPTIQSSTFQNAKINKIIVPIGTGAAYKAATNWSALADKIEEATE